MYKLKLIIILSMFLSLFNLAYAGCSNKGSYTTHTQIFNFEENTSDIYSRTFTMEPTGISCDNDKDTIYYVSSLNDKVIGFYDGAIKFKVSVTLTPGQEVLGKTKNTSRVSYLVNLTKSTAQVNSSVIGGTITVPSAVTASTDKNASNVVLSFFMCLFSGDFFNCLSDRVNKLSGATFQENITFNFVPKNSTCLPIVTAPLVLPDVQRAELRSIGTVNSLSGSTQIALHCDNAIGNNSMRGISVYLSSDDLLDGSDFILKDKMDNGVGFELSSGTANRIHLLRTGNSISNSPDVTIIKKIKKGEQLLQQYTIPVTAKYYVYDVAKIRTGKLNATAYVRINYD